MGRRLGQHFLSRKSILDRIARAACLGEARGDSAPIPLIIEIGPGKGALTASLLEVAARVVAVEVDPYLVHYLRQKFASALDSRRLSLIEGDILKTDLACLISQNGGHAAIAGNLPYYITSPILERIFSLESWERAVFLVQSEVAARLAASPGTRAYGYLSVLAQLHSRPQILVEVSRAAFHPPPKVDSAVIALEPRDASAEFELADKTGFLQFAAACFRQKRKTLRNNLAPIYGHDRIDALAEGKKRAEQLSVPELVNLYRALKEPCPAT